MSTARILEYTARQSARWSIAAVPSRVLAKYWDVSAGRARHMRSSEKNPLSITLALIMDPAVDGPKIVAAFMEALEHRYLLEADRDPEKLRARLDYLVSREHDLEAKQNRSLQSGENVNAALLEHSAALYEIVAIRRALGLEDDDR